MWKFVATVEETLTGKESEEKGVKKSFRLFWFCGEEPGKFGIELDIRGQASSQRPVYFRDIEFCQLEGEEEQTTTTR